MDEENPLMGKENSPCLFCKSPVAIEGEGYMGVIVGHRTICEGCIRQLSEVIEKYKT